MKTDYYIANLGEINMGNTFEVWIWEPIGKDDDDRLDGFSWVQLYAGESKEEAFATLEALKAKNAARVKLEWR